VLNDTADLHDDDAVEMFFDMADTDHDGQISFDDFLRVIRDEE
jgi:Ca2+-binding EF-hand superfamily protein